MLRITFLYLKNCLYLLNYNIDLEILTMWIYYDNLHNNYNYIYLLYCYNGRTVIVTELVIKGGGGCWFLEG